MANGTNKKIQNQLSKAGKNVNYREASAIAEKLGVTTDRVYNQTQKTGQAAVAGSYAANAGYVPSEQLKVQSPITQDYVQTVSDNMSKPTGPTYNGQPLQDGVTYQLNDAGDQIVGVVGIGDGATASFDWNAWNSRMAQQQAAIWEAMDAMNSQFLQQQQSWRDSQQTQGNPQRQPLSAITSGSDGGRSSDPAQVKRQRKGRGVSTTIGNSSLNIGGTSSAGTGNLGSGNSRSVSLGG
jgi:hypothetical protein